MNPHPSKLAKPLSTLCCALLITSGITVGITACSSSNNTAELMEKAKQHLAQNDKKSAVIEIKNALQKDPNLGEARYLLGKTSLDEGDAKSAEIELRRAYTLKFDPDRSIPALARAMLALNQAQQMLLEFEGQKLQAPEAQAEMQTLTGNAYLKTGKLDKANEAFMAAQAIQPGHVESALGEARVLFAQNDLDGAEAKINAVLEKNPKSVSALTWLGDLERTRGHYDQAIAHYQAALAVEPNNFSAHFVLANAYLASNKMEPMRAEVQALKKLSPKHAGVIYLDALVAFEDKKYKEAKEAIQQSLAINQENPQALLLAGVIEQALNEPAQSEMHLKQALVTQPSSLLARTQLARLYLSQRDVAKAEALLSPALRALPDNVELLNLAGDIAIAKGAFSEASQFYARSSELNPKSAQTLTQSAITQLATGNNDAGMAKLETASQMDQENTRADIALVLVHLNKKEYDQALKSWQTLQKKQPDQALTYNLQAVILLGKADFAGARKALEHAVAIEPTYFPAVSNLATLDLRDKQTETAKQRYRSVLEKDKNNLHALMALAQLEQSIGAPRETVLALLTQAKQGNPDMIQPVLALVNYRLETGDTKQALIDINEALIKMPKNPQLLDVAGFTQLQAGQADQAVETYSQLVRDNPKQANLFNRLGQAQLAIGKTEAAVQSMTKALDLQPDDINLQVSAVTLLLRAGKADDAATILAVIQKRSPKSPVLLELSGNTQMAKGDYQGAITLYKKVLTITPGSANLVKLYRALNLAGNNAEAESLLNTWIKNHPNDFDTMLNVANDAFEKNDYPKAGAFYRSILDKQSDNLLALNNLAWVSLQVKDGKALGYAEKAYAAAPENPAVLDTLGWVLSEQGQGKRGIELLEKAVTLTPQQWDIVLHLAKAQIKDGRKDAAREHLKAIVKASANSDAGKESAQILSSL